MKPALLFISAVSLLCTAAMGKKCSDKLIEKLVQFESDMIYSPGYPDNYEVNDDCTWVFTAVVEEGGFAIQLATKDIDLHDPMRNCESDYLAAYEGEGTDGKQLAKWCGEDLRIVKSTNQKVTLHFHSDGGYTGKGFVVSYSLVKFTPAECDDSGNVPVIEVGTSPIYESFQAKKSVARCEWQVKTMLPDQKLVFELYGPSNIECTDGVFKFYDGEDSSDHVSFEYCSSNQPFSRKYLSTNRASLVFEHNNVMEDDPDALVLKISARSPTYDCSGPEMPSIEVRDGPVMISLPYATNNADDTPCPLKLWTRNDGSILRLDVMGTSEKKADCDTDVISVIGAQSNSEIRRSCNRKTNPVFFGNMRDGMVITSKVDTSTTFLRASELYWTCGGGTREHIAYDTLIQSQTLPKEGGYPPLTRCQHLITTEKDMEIIALTIRWLPPCQEKHDTETGAYPPSETGNCQGDYINVYDGNSESSPLLFSSCHPDTYRDSCKINEVVYSTRNQLLVIMDSDARLEGESFTISFHSIPGGELCTDPEEIVVTRTPKTLTSLNYPGKFPRNQKCLTHLVSQQSGDDIIVKIVDSQLDIYCQSVLIVYEGKFEFGAGMKLAARVCGKDSQTITIVSDRATLLTLSEDFTGTGGWKAEVYTKTRTRGSGNDGNVLKPAILSLLLVLSLCSII